MGHKQDFELAVPELKYAQNKIISVQSVVKGLWMYAQNDERTQQTHDKSEKV